MPNTLVRGGRILDPGSDIDLVGDVLLVDGRVAAIGAELEANGADVIEASGLVVSPGFVDLHCHLRDPGFEYKESIASGTQDSRFSTGCSWGDFNRDGHIDLYVCNYVDFVYKAGMTGVAKRQYDTEQPYTLNPSAYAPLANALFLNRGDGTFENVAEAAGVADCVLPLDLDATHDLPFPDDYFQALFCMQSLHSFGADTDVVRRLLRHLEPRGRLGVGGTCFNQEPDRSFPEVYQETDGWDAEYRNYHSPPWWRTLFEETRLVDVLSCEELDDGLVMWEDDVLYHGHSVGWDSGWFEKSKWLIDQLVFSRDHRPYLTHYTATVEKKAVVPLEHRVRAFSTHLS